MMMSKGIIKHKEGYDLEFCEMDIDAHVWDDNKEILVKDILWSPEIYGFEAIMGIEIRPWGVYVIGEGKSSPLQRFTKK